MIKHINLVLVVWGDSYIDLLFKVSFPSHLAPKNLPALSKRSNVRYLIYTTSEGRKNIEERPLFNEIKKHANIIFYQIEFGIKANKYRLMTSCHSHAIKMADKSPLFFLNPDAIYSDGTFDYLQKRIQEGKRTVIVSGIRLAKEPFLSLFEKDKNFSYRSRDLVSLALQSVHPAGQAMFWENDHIHQAPHHLYWKLENEGLLVRAFHQHPLMIWPTTSKRPSSNIDGDYIKKACPTYADWHLVTDSDALFIYELTPQASESDFHSAAKDLKKIVSWMRRGTSPLHREFIKHKIVIHTGLATSKYSEIYEQSDEIVNSLLKEYSNARPYELFQAFLDRTKVKCKMFLARILPSFMLFKNRHFKIHSFTEPY